MRMPMHMPMHMSMHMHLVDVELILQMGPPLMEPRATRRAPPLQIRPRAWHLLLLRKESIESEAVAVDDRGDLMGHHGALKDDEGASFWGDLR